MFEKIKDSLKRLINSRPFDPSVFNDPVALKTGWGELKTGGPNFRTQKIKIISPDRAAVKPAAGILIFCAVFIFTGSYCIYYAAKAGIEKHNLTSAYTLAAGAFGLVFIVMGAVAFFSGAKPVVFDKMSGLYRKGFGEPDIYLRDEKDENSGRLSDIHALQILAKYPDDYSAYELNLVLKDGTRINVINSGNYRKLAGDAGKLSGFLGVPLWDREQAINNEQ